MAQQAREAIVKYGYQVDTASIAAVKDANESVKGSAYEAAQSIRDAFKTDTAKDFSSALRTDVQQAIAQTNRDVASLRDALKNDKGGGGGDEDSGSVSKRSISELGELFSKLPGGQSIGEAARQLGTLNDLFTKLPDQLSKSGTSLAQLGTAGALAAGAVIAIQVALQAYNDGLQEAKDDLNAALKAQQDYYAALGTMTSKQVQDEIAKRQQQQAVLQAQLDETTAAYKANGGVLENIGKNTGQLADLDKALQAQRVAAGENEQAIYRLTTGLQNNAFAANDAAAAQKQLLDQAQKDFVKSLNDLTDTETQGIALQTELKGLNKQSADSLRSTVEANKERIAILQAELPTLQQQADLEKSAGIENGKATAAVKQYSDELYRLQAVNAQITNSTLAQVEAREAEKKALQDFQAAMREVPKLIGDIAKAQQQYSADVKAANAKLAAEAADYAEKRAQEEQDFATQQQREAEDAARAQADRQRKLNDELTALDAQRAQAIGNNTRALGDAAKKYADDVESIKRKQSDDLAEAAGTLDARQVNAIQRNAKEQLEQRGKQYEDEKASLKRALDDQLKALDDQRAAKLRAFQQESQDQAQQLQQRQAREQQDFATRQAREAAAFAERRATEEADIAARRAADLQKLTEAQDALKKELSLKAIANNEIVSGAQSVANAIGTIFQGLKAAASTAASNTTTNNSTTYNGAASATVNVNGANMTPDQIARIATNAAGNLLGAVFGKS